MTSAVRALRIGIDAHGVGGHSLGLGNETYFRNLITSLLSIDSSNEYHLFADHPEELEPIVDGRPNARVVSLFPPTQWIQRPLSLPLYARRHDLDVLHVPFIRPPFVHAKTVVTVHDVSFEFHPEFYRTVERWRMRLLVPQSCRSADLILTVSEYSRRQLHERYRVPLDKIVVTYNAADHISSHNGDTPRDAVPLEVPYVLYLGMIQPRKNLVRLVRAFDRIKSRSHLPHHLVFAGAWGWGNDELTRTLESLEHRQSIHVVGYRSSGAVQALLRNATVFAFPSIFESFGIPPLEAQRCGVPVLLSDGTCFPEIYGQSALYCDPLSEESIADALERLLRDGALRADLVRKGRERAGQYSWERTARIALDAYRRVAETS